VPKLPGVNHLRAVRALQKAGFKISNQGKHIVMTDGTRIITVPRNNPVNEYTMGGTFETLASRSSSSRSCSSMDGPANKTMEPTQKTRGSSLSRSAATKGLCVIEIREERPGDVSAIHDVNKRAFGQDQEGNIVDALRSNGAALLSLVATLDDRVVGHIMYSPISVGGEIMGAALGLKQAHLESLTSH
jgi:hypothetical protein